MTNLYANGRIYKLICHRKGKNEIYVGSTCNTLAKRKAEHKHAARHRSRRVYNYFNSTGWGSVKAIQLEKYPCVSKDELTAREQYWIDILNPSLNSQPAYAKCKHNKKRPRCGVCNKGKYRCDFCGCSLSVKGSIRIHNRSAKHKQNYKQAFFDNFGLEIADDEVPLFSY